jgi:outer membrane receptor protein involved in Fe transport
LKARRRFSNGAWLGLTQKFMLMARGVPGLMGFTASQAKESGWTELLDIRIGVPAGSLLLEGGADLFTSGRALQDPLGELTGTVLDQDQELRVLGAHLMALVPFGTSHMLRSRLNWRWTGLDDDGFANPERRCLSGEVSAQLKLAANLLEINPWLRLEHTSDTGWQLAPGLGLAYEIQPGLLVKSNLARAYRVPNFNELYLSGGFQVGNPDLVPERGWTFDAGLEWRPSKSYRVSLAGFYSRYSQLIVYEPISNFRYKPLNTDGAEIGGIEIEASLRPLRWLDIAAHYTFLLPTDRSGRSNRDGNDLPGRPRHTAGLRLNGKWNRWLARAAVSFVGANFINQANTKQLPYRFLLNLGLGVDAGSGMTVMLEAKNLLDNQVQDVRGLPLPGISFFLTIGITKGEE